MHVVHLLERAMPPPRPEDAGGLPQLVAWLAEAQQQAGHRVTLITPTGQTTSTYQQRSPGAWSAEGVAAALPADAEIVHAHGETESLCRISHELGRRLPVITTIHGNGTPTRPAPVNPVFLSRDHARRHHGRHHVYNGLPVDAFPLAERDRRGVLFLGKLRRSKKGAGKALRIARAAGEHLYLAGRPSWKLPASRLPFWPGVTALGAVHGAAKLRALQQARCLLVPIEWDEPFGLTVIEALATGTPVVASARGAMPELITHGEQGFLCRDEHAMIDALRAIGTISPAACRQRVLECFDIRRVEQDYAHLYRQALLGECWSSAPR